MEIDALTTSGEATETQENFIYLNRQQQELAGNKYPWTRDASPNSGPDSRDFHTRGLKAFTGM